MTSAILRLIAIIAGTLCLTFLAVVFVRWAGKQQQFAEPPHPWFALANWTVTEPALDKFCGDRSHNPQTVTVAPTSIAFIKIHNTAQGWSLACPSYVPPKALLEKSTHPNWLVYVDSRETTSLEPLITELTAFDKAKNLGIFSPSQIVARYLRKKAPQWVYGADAATMLRLHMFAGFWVETAFDFWPDFVLQNKGDKNAELSERELAELQRRKKRIIQVEINP